MVQRELILYELKKIIRLSILDTYNIDLTAISSEEQEFTYTLSDEVFSALHGSFFTRGNIEAKVFVRRVSGVFEFDFAAEGDVWISCDYCLEDMKQEVVTEGGIRVVYGEHMSDNEELIVHPSTEKFFNIAWYIYECIVLALPMKHTHKPGECNQEMKDKLDNLLVSKTDLSESDDEEIDPRWNKLKEILDNK